MIIGLSFILTGNACTLASDTVTVVKHNGNHGEIEINEDVKSEFNIEDFQDVIDEMTEDIKITIHDFIDSSTDEQNDINEVKHFIA